MHNVQLIKENEELKAQRRKLEMENVLKTQQVHAHVHVIQNVSVI